MAKTKKPSKPKVAKKLSKEELENVKELQTKIQSLVLNLGSAELAKQAIAKQHADLTNEWKAMTAELEKKYGQVNVNLEDGSLSPIESSEEK
jgi:uncharacterized phage infection (PIP) family protein YhgE|tara:strand:- start:1384 stop:1659 length:276 start_codon:yes stop_codon:yes gene_type:complete